MVNQNVETIASLRARSEAELSKHQRGIERITAALGRPRSIYVVLSVVALWVGFNTFAAKVGLRPPDPPPFEALQALVGLAALLMTIMVLTTQNRQSKHTEQRAHLDLQVNLLAEQKVAKLIALLEELRRDIPAVPDRVDREAQVMTEPLDPAAVMTALEGTLTSRPESGSEAQPPDTERDPPAGSLRRRAGRRASSRSRR
jgi:uncharacterized membrane protein